MAAGIHYNLALSFHDRQILDMLDNYNYNRLLSSSNFDSELINSYHYPHHPSSKITFEKLPILPPDSIPEPTINLMRLTHSSWPYQMFLSNWRIKTSPLCLLSVYGKAFQETNGFKNNDVDPDFATKIINELSHLQIAIDQSHFTYRRAGLYRIENKEPTFVEFKVFYDNTKTSYKQALSILRDNIQDNNYSKYFFEECLRDNILSYRMDLLALMFLCQTKNLKKTQYLDNKVIRDYVLQLRIEEHHNENSLQRRLTYLNNKTQSIKIKYDIDNFNSNKFNINKKNPQDISLNIILNQAVYATEYFSYLISEEKSLSPIYKDLLTTHGNKSTALQYCSDSLLVEENTFKDNYKLLLTCLSFEIYDFVKYFHKALVLSNGFRNNLTIDEANFLKVQYPTYNNNDKTHQSKLDFDFMILFSAHHELMKALKIEKTNTNPTQLMQYNPNGYSSFLISNNSISNNAALKLALNNYNNSLFNDLSNDKEIQKNAKNIFKKLLGLHYYFEKDFIKSKTSMNKILSYYPDEQPSVLHFNEGKKLAQVQINTMKELIRKQLE